MQQFRESAPRIKARICGIFYLLIFVVNVLPEFYIRGRLIIDSDAAATARNILAHESLFRLGGAAQLIVLTCDIAVALILRELLSPVSRSLSSFAAVFRLVFVSIMAVNSLNYFAPLVLLKAPFFMTPFNPDQDALVIAFLRLYGVCYAIALVFFGFSCLLVGYLIFRSTFLPRMLGILMAFAGLAWLTFLWPPLANNLEPYVLLPGLIGEGSLTLWLLIVGVNGQQWNQMARATTEWKI